MATAQAGVLRHIRELVAAEQTDRLPDHELLERFIAAHQEAAFAALVRRHGPLVLGVCRRVLGNAADAEDAFQAAFLVLARKATTIRKRESLSGWLARVAYHTALRARRQAAVRRQHEQQAVQRSQADPFAELTGRELLSVLDEELQRLPERYRAPLVQCYLQGATCDEAARSIGWPLRTLKRRLEQGRNRLRTRLANRGLALSAALLAAGLTHGATVSLPARLIDMTARAAIQAAGVASASAVTLAQGVLSAMLTARLKLVAAVLLLAGLITVGAGALAQSTGASAQADPTVAARQVPLPAVLQKKMESGGDKELIAAGRVLGTDGKPLPGAEVALVGRWRRTDTQKPDTEVLARGKTDEQGRFRLVRKGAAPQQLYDLHLFAGGKDAGIVWRDLRRSPGKDALELKLEPEQSLRGRMFDLQGVPAKGVKGRIVYAARKFNPASKDAANRERMYASMYVRALGGGVTPTRSPGGVEFRLTELPAGLALWPQPLTTDAEGRFEIRGFAANHEVHLLIDDDRFALQELQIETATKPQPKEISLSLAPSRRIEGRIICEDTGKPMAGVELVVSAFRGANGRDAFARTDAQGRYSVNPYPGDTFTIRAWPPTGEPYVGVEQQLTWTKGAARQTLDFNLPRGVTVKGQVVEAPAGKALARVRVFYLPRVEGNPQLRRGLLVGSYWPARSAADGTFRLVVPVGPGHLLVNADNPETGADDPDLVTRVVSLGELRGGKADGTLRYYHEVLPVNFQIKDDPKNLEIKLQRGVTLRGQVVGPDGNPVKRAVLFCSGDLMRPQDPGIRVVGFPGGNPGTGHAIEVRDGKFEVPGCNPNKKHRVFILDISGEAAPERAGQFRLPATLPPLLANAKGRLGAAVELSAKPGNEPITVRLTPCGSAEVGVVDDKGKPAKANLWLEMIVTPARGQGGPEWVTLGGPGEMYRPLASPPLSRRGPQSANWALSALRPGADGRLTIPALIPGATYRLRIFDARDLGVVRVEREFTVESGKTSKLPDIVLTP